MRVYRVVLWVRVYLEISIHRLVRFCILDSGFSIELAHCVLVVVRGAHVCVSSTLVALFATLAARSTLVATQKWITFQTIPRV